MKILHGVTEVAGQGINSVIGLRSQGMKADMVVYRSNKSGYEKGYDLHIGRKKWLLPFDLVKMIAFFFFALIKYDCFHFHFDRTLLPKALDLPVLKFFKKKIFMEFHGTELRGVLVEYQSEIFQIVKRSPAHKKLIKKLIKHADGIILHDEELRKYIPYDVPIYIVPLRVEIEKLVPTYSNMNNERIMIVHAPTKRDVKGTKYILETMEEFKEEIDFVLIENKKREEAWALYQKADIIIDQLILGTYGVLSIESMALGKPVITNISDGMKSVFPEELPVVNANIYNLKEKVEELIQNKALRHELGVRGREYVETYHKRTKNAILLKNIYTGKQESSSGEQRFCQLKEFIE